MGTRGITSEWHNRKFSSPHRAESSLFHSLPATTPPRPLCPRGIYPRSPSYLGVPFIPALPSFVPEIKGTPRCWSLVRPISLLRPAAGQDTYHPPEMENERARAPFCLLKPCLKELYRRIIFCLFVPWFLPLILLMGWKERTHFRQEIGIYVMFFWCQGKSTLLVIGIESGFLVYYYWIN